MSLRAQYLRLKQPFPNALVLFRLGDFYEIYDADARVAAHALGLTPSTREFAGSERVPLCPLPYHAVEGHIKRLVAHGYTVAIAEQIGDPRITTGFVVREVVRVVTPASVIEAHRHPPSGRTIGPAGAEPDASGRSRTRRGTAAPVPSTPSMSADVSVTAPVSAPDGGREE